MYVEIILYAVNIEYKKKHSFVFLIHNFFFIVIISMTVLVSSLVYYEAAHDATVSCQMDNSLEK